MWKNNVTILQPSGWTKQPLIITHYRIAQPNKDLDSMSECEQGLVALNVGAILNVANDCVALSYQRDFYDEIEVAYHEELIQDEGDEDLPDHYLANCLEIYSNIPEDKSLLIHCALGINRSAAAAAAILWQHTNPRPWSKPEELIDWMRSQQRTSRNCELLRNQRFVDGFVNWANSIL